MSSQNFVKGILLGLSGAGKTSLIAQRNCSDIHNLDSTPNPLPTMLTMDVPFNTKKLKFQIWDTAGQDEMHKVTKNIYHGSQVVSFSLSAPNFLKLYLLYLDMTPNLNIILTL